MAVGMRFLMRHYFVVPAAGASIARIAATVAATAISAATAALNDDVAAAA
jgi:hypothetical protein